MLNNLEQAALHAFRAGDSPLTSAAPPSVREDWLRFGIECLLEIGAWVRSMRFAPLAGAVVFKGDGSPTVPEEYAIEQYLRDRLQLIAPTASVRGEESGGSLSEGGISVAIDPVDGTWELVNRSSTHATSLAFFDRGQLFLGMIANAATGEIAYALAGQRSRLLQLSCFGEADSVVDLPLDRPANGPILVNLHPAGGAEGLSASLYEAWGQRKISMLKSMGGSPAWALLEATKGAFIYINLWAARAPEAFDLAGSVLLLRQAGGEAVGLNGEPIDELTHRGLFVAGIDQHAVSEIVQICRKSDPG
jgi:fructose-1,6-bisphosphatase/inositol monophosphatase family enzyme